jgi:hypothetical protein
MKYKQTTLRKRIFFYIASCTGKKTDCNAPFHTLKTFSLLLLLTTCGSCLFYFLLQPSCKIIHIYFWQKINFKIIGILYSVQRRHCCWRCRAILWLPQTAMLREEVHSSSDLYLVSTLSLIVVLLEWKYGEDGSHFIWWGYQRLYSTLLTRDSSERKKGKTARERPQSGQSAKLFLQSSELGLSQPLTRSRVCPHPPGSGGGAHSLARERLGESQFRRGDIHCGGGGTLYKYVLCGRDGRDSCPHQATIMCCCMQGNSLMFCVYRQLWRLRAGNSLFYVGNSHVCLKATDASFTWADNGHMLSVCSHIFLCLGNSHMFSVFRQQSRVFCVKASVTCFLCLGNRYVFSVFRQQSCVFCIQVTVTCSVF